MKFLTKFVLAGSLIPTALWSSLYLYFSERSEAPMHPLMRIQNIPSRQKNFQTLQQKIFDLLVVGGGATGAGVALDATLRGLDVALIEKGDFASGTSSKSSKLVHGGVRYLEKALLKFDYQQFKLVSEALKERKTFLSIAPHLTKEISISLPLQKYWEVPYYWTGIKLYDSVAYFAGGCRQPFNQSGFVNKKESLRNFPLFKSSIIGTIVYHDGQMNDARVNVTLATSSSAAGATVANYCELLDFQKIPSSDVKDKEPIFLSRVKDTMTGEVHTVKSRGIISAVGPQMDQFRIGHPPIVTRSLGTHITISVPVDSIAQVDRNNLETFGSGIIIPKTSDGRVLFFLPWRKKVIVGTTDAIFSPDQPVSPPEKDISFIVDELNKFLSVKIKREDVTSAWSGVRPLISSSHSTNQSSSNIVRSSFIEVDPITKLISTGGGKWTTYRKMAEDTVDVAVKTYQLSPKNSVCQTMHTTLLGSSGEQAKLISSKNSTSNTSISSNNYSNSNENNKIDLLKEAYHIPTDVAEHLVNSYGSEAEAVLKTSSGSFERLSDHYPFIEKEIIYSMENEFAMTPADFLCRRVGLTFLDAKEALRIAPQVADVMSKHKGWQRQTKDKILQDSLSEMNTQFHY